MEETILKYQIALTKLKGIGPILAKNLLAYFGDVLPIFEENVRMLSSVQGVGSVLANEIVEQRNNVLLLADRELEFLQKRASLLIEMEFKDIIKCLPGNNYRLR